MINSFCVFIVPEFNLFDFNQALSKWQFKPIGENENSTMGFVEFDTHPIVFEKFPFLQDKKMFLYPAHYYKKFIIKKEEKVLSKGILENEFEKYIISKYSSVEEYKLKVSKERQLEIKTNFEKELRKKALCKSSFYHCYIIKNKYGTNYLIVDNSNKNKVAEMLEWIEERVFAIGFRYALTEQSPFDILPQKIKTREDLDKFSFQKRLVAKNKESNEKINIIHDDILGQNIHNLIDCFSLDIEKVGCEYQDIFKFDFSPNLVFSSFKFIDLKQLEDLNPQFGDDSKGLTMFYIGKMLDDLTDEFGGLQHDLFH